MDILSASSWILRSQCLRGLPRTKRTIVRLVPMPLSPTPAPFLLRIWLAHVLRTNILRSIAESMENTPSRTPAGGKSSRYVGGNGGGSNDDIEDMSVGVRELNGYAGESEDALANGGEVDMDGIEQYTRQGNGSLSGLRMWIKSSVSRMAKIVSRKSVRSCEKKRSSECNH